MAIPASIERVAAAITTLESHLLGVTEAEWVGALDELDVTRYHLHDILDELDKRANALRARAFALATAR